MPRHGMVLCPCYSISLGYFQYWCSLAFFPSIDYIELESVTLVAVLQLKVAIVLSVRRGGGVQTPEIGAGLISHLVQERTDNVTPQ